MITFSAPAFLWGLLGLSIPVAIHLLSRAEGRIIKVGSIRHFEESATSKFKSIRLNEVSLLLLRCLMIALLVLFLSGMRCTTASQHAPSWVLIEEGLEGNPTIAASVDSLSRQGYDVRHLAKGFPAIEKDTTLTLTNYWRLIDDLSSRSLDQVVVFATSRVCLFKGERSSLPPNVSWVSVDLPPSHFPLIAYESPGGTIRVVEASTSVRSTSFEQKRIRKSDWQVQSLKDQIPLSPLDTIRISLIANAAARAEQNVFLAAVRALSHSTDYIIETVDSSSNYDFQFIIPDRGTEAATQNIGSGEILKRGGGNQWVISKKLTPTLALQDHLVIALGQVILPEVALRPENDARQMPDGMRFAAPSRDTLATLPKSHSLFLGNYLLALLGLVWIGERYVSMKRNQ